jgi:hypothetical protein
VVMGELLGTAPLVHAGRLEGVSRRRASSSTTGVL